MHGEEASHEGYNPRRNFMAIGESDFGCRVCDPLVAEVAVLESGVLDNDWLQTLPS
jgi:hypothetical protein